MGLPKIGGLFRSPYNRDPTVWGAILGSPIFGNLHIIDYVLGFPCHKPVAALIEAKIMNTSSMSLFMPARSLCMCSTILLAVAALLSTLEEERTADKRHSHGMVRSDAHDTGQCIGP